MELEQNDGVIPSDSLFRKARYGEDTIVANLDTGVWPESPSFRDDGMGPIPSRWKGTCQHDITGFRCNRKLIGARYFNKGYIAYAGPNATFNSTLNTARDYEGHGSHTLSTIGGTFVPGANVFGLGNGTAEGGSPKARLATYKVCWPPIDGNECFDADIMAAFDMAIHDGVDVLSLSLGGAAMDYFDDGLSIGAFHAIKKASLSCALLEIPDQHLALFQTWHLGYSRLVQAPWTESLTLLLNSTMDSALREQAFLKFCRKTSFTHSSILQMQKWLMNQLKTLLCVCEEQLTPRR
ncbi:Subtilisin protease SBT5.3 [Spatholobus suberectus]|nr:Subtilisin protease SBT5.3 [Spatholobus suberectus]